MKIRHLAVLPTVLLMAACGGSAPEAETPAGEAAAGAAEQKPAEEAKPADDAKPADAPAAGGEEKKEGGEEKK
jgi:hypothetical protein